MTAKIIGYVFRNEKLALEKVLRFFSCVGISFAEEQHESGPVHQVALFSSDAVLEIYPKSSIQKDDLLLIEVDSITGVLSELEKAGLLQVVTEKPNNTLVVAPDGRYVLLTHKK